MEVNMTKRGSFIFRLLAAIVLIGLLAAGGYALYNVGYAHGFAEGAVAEIPQAQDGFRMMPWFAYGHGLMRLHFGFSPFMGILGFLFVALLFFALLRLVFRPWGMHPMYAHGYPPAWGTPPWARGNPITEGQTPEEQTQANTPPQENS
jgi:hypothetical protein